MTDERGVVTEKFFHRHYATRESAGTIRDSALGRILARHEAPAVELGTDHVRIFDGSRALRARGLLAHVRPAVPRQLHRVGSDDSRHLRPARGDGAVPADTPAGVPRARLTLNVYEGVVDVAIPVTPNAEVFHRSNPDRPEVVDVPRTRRLLQLDACDAQPLVLVLLYRRPSVDEGTDCESHPRRPSLSVSSRIARSRSGVLDDAGRRSDPASHGGRHPARERTRPCRRIRSSEGTLGRLADVRLLSAARALSLQAAGLDIDRAWRFPGRPPRAD